MVSQTALTYIGALEKDGLKPSVADIIRLNALGLKLESSAKKNAADSLDYLPRVAKISPTISFRQPTVGHEIWLHKVDRLTAATLETEIAVKAYALSRPCSALPDPDDPSAVRKAVDAFAEMCRDLTREQIYAALDYVIYGPSPLVGEHPALPRMDDERVPDGSAIEDWKYCVAVGVLREAQAVMLGLNQAELEAMPRRQLEDLIERAYFFHHIERSAAEEQCRLDFFTTLDEITERLKKENGNG